MITSLSNTFKAAFGVSAAALMIAGCTVNVDATEAGGEAGGEAGAADTAAAQTAEAGAATSASSRSATSACQAGEFEDQFADFVGSESARALYTMPVVEVSTMTRTATGYADGSVERTPKARFISNAAFPLRRVGSKYALTIEPGAYPDADDLLNVQFDFMNATDSWLVSFVPTQFDAKGRPDATYGDRQEWSFDRDGACWKLQQVVIYPGYGDK